MGNGLSGQDNGNIVDAVGHIVNGNIVALEDGQHLAQIPHFTAQAAFAHGNDAEIFLAGDAGEEAVRVGIPLEGFLNHGSRIAGGIGVADVQRNVLFPHGEDGALVKHLGTGVAQLPQLVIGDLGDGGRVIHNAGVGHEDAGYIRPVFIHVGIQRRRRQSPGDVGAAPGEGADFTVGHPAIKAGDDHAEAFVQLF